MKKFLLYVAAGLVAYWLAQNSKTLDSMLHNPTNGESFKLP